jgi:A/G-specific adenine glycosylase
LPDPIQLDARQRSRLRARLLDWYRRQRRDLPWRHTRDPYRIWVSEIMLQQTRVAAVLERYGRFQERFPDVRSLARAGVAEVLILWSGLGYYRRARALHEAAREIIRSGAAMPRTAEQWRELPGIGRYTAAAIASIAHGESCAVVDGNVERVVRRVTADPDGSISKIWETAEAWLSRKRPGDFNQAMMELGATVCLPASPRCHACPLHAWCATRGALAVKATAARRRRESAYALVQKRGSIYLKQRTANESLMPGMWELPEITPNGHAPAFTLRHAITVTDFRVSVVRSSDVQQGGRWVKFDRLATLPLTGLTRKILRRAGII